MNVEKAGKKSKISKNDQKFEKIVKEPSKISKNRQKCQKIWRKP